MADPVKAEPKAEPVRYRVLHTRVGEFERGETVPASDFQAGTDFGRLLSLGAVEVVAPDPAK